jgi:hypothetical protein
LVGSPAFPTGFANHCSYVVLRYLPRLMALVGSIGKFDAKSLIYVLFLDEHTMEQSKRALGEKGPTFSLSELEEAFD